MKDVNHNPMKQKNLRHSRISQIRGDVMKRSFRACDARKLPREKYARDICHLLYKNEASLFTAE